MKSLKDFALGVTIFLSMQVSFAWAGGSDGSGGKGVVCRNPDGSILSVELLDLWEERTIRRRQIAASDRSVAEQVAAAIDNLKNAVNLGPGLYYEALTTKDGKHRSYGTVADYNAAYLRGYARLFLDNSKPIVKLRDVKLTLTNDSYEAAQPTGKCGIEQVVNFIDSSTSPEILVNEDLLERMDNTNKAALYVHEAFYFFMRGYGSNLFSAAYHETDSVRIRRAIGYIFSGHKLESIDKLTGTTYIQCETATANSPEYSSLFVFKDTQGKSRIANTIWFGKPAIGFFADAGESALSYDEMKRWIENPSCGPARKSPHRRTDPQTSTRRMSISYDNPGLGPVDFQKRSWISRACIREKIEFHLLDETHVYGATDKATAPQKLRCRLMKPGSSNYPAGPPATPPTT